MPYRTDIAYLYDGSFEGLMCCVFESYYKKELPEIICGPDEFQMTLYDVKYIDSEPDKAKRVEKAIKNKISKEAHEFVESAFLTALPDKELHILEFLRAGFSSGRKIMEMLTDDRVSVLKAAVANLTGESTLYAGFVRFSELGGVLVSVIEPKNYVLPLLQEHFCDRFPDECFIIYDKTHCMMLIGERGEARLGYVDSFEPGEAGYEEKSFRRLWQSFYDAIGISQRYNPRCRMTHMPKRYWSHMSEFWGNNPQSAEFAGPPIKDIDAGMDVQRIPGEFLDKYKL